jgi:chromosome segregation ATPase
MLSIIPGQGQGQGQGQGGAGAVGPKPSKSVFGGARKLVQSMSGGNGNNNHGPSSNNNNNNSNNNAAEAAKKQRAKKPATLEDIDRILEKDALDLTNMKREVVETQNAEIVKAQAALALIQREYDTVRVANNSKEKELSGIMDTIRTLQNVGAARIDTIQAAGDTKQSLHDDFFQTQDNLEAELRTLAMQTLMSTRLEKEIVETKMECSQVNAVHEVAKHDLSGLETTLRLCRQELLESEKELESLLATVKSRKEERETKMNMMFGIVSQSQSSVLKIKKVLDRSMDDNKTPRGGESHRHKHHHHHDHSRGHASHKAGPEEDHFSASLLFRSPGQVMCCMQVNIRCGSLQ